MDEHEAAAHSLKQFEKYGGPAEQVATLREELEKSRAAFDGKQKKMFKKMFA